MFGVFRGHLTRTAEMEAGERSTLPEMVGKFWEFLWGTCNAETKAGKIRAF